MEQAGTAIAITSSVFGAIIILLVYIWNLTQKANEKRHEENERLINDLVKSKHTNDLILQKLELITSSQEERLKKLEQ